MEPLLPGQRLGPHLIKELLSWGPRGGLYRVEESPGSPTEGSTPSRVAPPKAAEGSTATAEGSTTTKDTAILKEFILPSGLSLEQRRARVVALQTAVAEWKKLKSPLAIPVLGFMPQLERIYLLLPEVRGSTLKVQVRLREEAPESGQSVRWADQLAGLLEEMLDRKHPLAFEVLYADRILVDSQGNLVVFNPGWSELLWRDPQHFLAPPMAEGLKLYGNLIQGAAAGDRGHPARLQDLPAGLMWIVSRCSSPVAGRSYQNFTEVRKALRGLKVFGDEARNQRALGALPPLLGFTLPRLSDLPHQPRRFYLLMGALLLLLTVGLWWGIRQLSTNPPLRPGMALAVGRDLYLFSLHLPLQRVWRFPTAIKAMDSNADGSRLYLALQDDGGVQIFDSDRCEVRPLTLGNRVLSLCCAQAGKELQVYLESGRLLRLNVEKGVDRALDSVTIPRGLSAWTYVRLDNPENPQRAHQHPESLLTLHVHEGIHRFDATTGRKLESWLKSGYSALITTPKGEVFLASEHGEWVFLDARLRPRKSGRLPASAGEVRLLTGSDPEHFWSLQNVSSEQAVLARWDSQELRPLFKVRLDSAPEVASTDDRGNLWWVDQQKRLFRASSAPLRIEQLETLPGAVSAMAYLAPDLTPRGLQRMMDQPPPQTSLPLP